MRYVVIEPFKDKAHKIEYDPEGFDGRPYEYPAQGKRASKARLQELSSSRNALGYPVIEAVEDDEIE